MAYQTALDNSWEPTKLSRVSTEKLSDMFVKLDRELKHGVSRRLVYDVLVKMKAASENDLKTEETSLSLKEFLLTMESKAC
jgi:hypothetical protein